MRISDFVFFETGWQISQYHNAVACGSAVNSIGSSAHDIARPTRYRVVVLTYLPRVSKKDKIRNSLDRLTP